MSLLQDENDLIEEVGLKNILVDVICGYLKESSDKVNIQNLDLSYPQIAIVTIVDIHHIMDRRYYVISENPYETRPHKQYINLHNKMHINEFEYINRIERIENINKFIKQYGNN